MHQIGVISPPAFWEAVAEAAEDPDALMRSEVAATLEQLGAPEALKLVKKAHGTEKEAQAERDFLRAYAACGRDDTGTRKKMLGYAKDKDAGRRHNALFALGNFAEDAEVVAVLTAALTALDARDSQAALLGSAAAQATQFLQPIAAFAQEGNGATEALELAQRVAAVLRAEAPLAGLGDDVVRVLGDTVRRERFFPLGQAREGSQ